MEESGGSSADGDEWAQRVLDSVFALEPVQWIRAHDFQVQSIKMVVRRALSHLPFYVTHPTELERGLKLSLGELPPRRFTKPVTLLACGANAGARELAEELKTAAEASGSSAVSVQEATTTLMTMTPQSRRSLLGSSSALLGNWTSSSTSAGAGAGKLYLILYLNADTFLDPRGRVAAAVKRALDLKIPISLLHEQDAAKGGCPFRIFFDQTPRELIEEPYKLFAPMAVPIFTAPEHREVGLHKPPAPAAFRPQSEIIKKDTETV